jgi:PII-like signaling protein
LTINIGAGVVDADYRGEIKILLFNLSNKPFEIKKGSKIAQFILEQIINPPIVKVQETSTIERGIQGFGLTNIPHAQEEKARATTQAITVNASDQDTIEQIIKEVHDVSTAGHPGIKATIHKIQRSYKWKSMHKDITNYINGCIVRQRTKPNHAKQNAPLNPIPPTNRPWQTISVDLIGLLWDSKGFNAILVIVNYYTKMKVLCPTTTHVMAMGIALLFRTHIF